MIPGVLTVLIDNRSIYRCTWSTSNAQHTYHIPRSWQLDPLKKSHSRPWGRPNVGHNSQEPCSVRCRRLNTYAVVAREYYDGTTLFQDHVMQLGKYQRSSEPQDDFESLMYCLWNVKTIRLVMRYAALRDKSSYHSCLIFWRREGRRFNPLLQAFLDFLVMQEDTLRRLWKEVTERSATFVDQFDNQS